MDLMSTIFQEWSEKSEKLLTKSKLSNKLIIMWQSAKYLLMKVFETASRLPIGQYEEQDITTISRFKQAVINVINENSVKFLYWTSTFINFFIL